MTTESSAVETIFKTQEGYNECDHCQSVLSPAAYFVKLVETIKNYIPAQQLEARRPDLFELKLDCDSTNKVELYLEIVNKVMQKNLNSKLGRNNLEKLAKKYSSINAYLNKNNASLDDLYRKLILKVDGVRESLGLLPEDYQLITSDVLEKLATTKYPFNLPANFPLISIRAYLEKQGITLADVYKALMLDADNVAELSGVAPKDYQLITSMESSEDELKKLYEIPSDKSLKDELEKVDNFIAKTYMASDKLKSLLENYNKIKGLADEEKLTIDSTKTIKNLNNQALGFLYHFIRLANKLRWPFDKLGEVLITIDNADNAFVAESLGLSPKEYEVITPTNSNLSEVYGISENQLKDVENFIAQTNMDYDRLERLLDCYNKIKKLTDTARLTIIDNETDSKTKIIKNLDSQALGFLHRFIRLANKLDWSFDELCEVLIAIGKNEIDPDSLKEVSRIKSLEEKFKKPLVEVCKLYPDASISMEKSANEKDANNAAESLFFLQGVKESDLRKVYGIGEPSEPFKEQSVDEFTTQTGIKREKVERLLNNYNKIGSQSISKKAKKPLNTEIRSTINVKEQKFLYNFTQLVEQLKLLFDKLNKLIKVLPNEFKLKDLVTNVNDSIVLQKIWNISDNELNSLINYNDNIPYENGKIRLLGVHKQILLARLMNISIAELIQILLQLNIDKLSPDNIKYIVELNDWLSNNSITIEQLNTLVNSSAFSNQYTEQISKIEEEIEELKSKKNLDSLVNSTELSSECKTKIKEILEKLESKKLKSKEKLATLINDPTLSMDCKTKIKGILEELESKEKLDALINDPTLSEECKIKEIIEKTENKKLKSKEKLDALTNDPTLSKKCKTKIEEIREGREELHNEIKKHFSVSSDLLAAAHRFTKKRATNLQLLRLESLNKSIVHDIGIIGNKAVFLGESKVLKKNSIEYSISEPRENVAVATVGTKTIFFGGKKSENEYSKKVDIYDNRTGKWTQRKIKEEDQKKYEARDSVAVAVIDNKAIFLGGNKSNRECSSQIEIYDDKAQQWTLLTEKASEARANASVAVVGDKAIFFGGEVGQRRSNKIDIYDNETGEWRSNTASEARAHASIAVVGTKVIFFGGNKGSNQPSAKVDIYDSNTKKWTTHTVSEARENASVAIVDGKAIFFGGKAGQTRSNKIDIYDAKTEKWIAMQNTASEARDMVSVAVVNKQAIFFGGSKGEKQYSKYIDIYDSATDSWKATDEISEAHEDISVAVIGAKAIFFTGKKNSRVTGQVYIYDSANYSTNDSINDFITKSWMKRIAKETEMRDGLLVEITNSTKYSGKIDIYDNTAKAWKAIDIYKPNECTSIRVQNNKAILTCKDSTQEQVYSISLAITYDATIEELLNNVAVFTTLKMDAEDINNITNHADTYKLKATWTKEQLRTLTDYKELQDAFSGNELTLSQYTEWLRYSYDENKVTEKIAQLTNWDKKILDVIKNIKNDTKLASLTNWDKNVWKLIKKIKAFEQCFNRESHSIDSLLKIKSFMDMVEKSGIDGKVLFKLGALYNLKAEEALKEEAKALTGWEIYDKTAKELESSLSSVEGVKEQLEDQKRNILANYMIYGKKDGNKLYENVKNMRNLYSFLLIDVEMSDCSNISPLKAGLNSLQLYIHRCILGLEEGTTVNRDQETGLSEEMWDLLSHYREWEVTKKIALYPENYLNPTLRKSATVEYKALQNTLMQGNITDEAAAYAYIKYFEDFAQLVNLQIVDTYFASEKLYIIGRTPAEPYTYYYRVGNFENNTNTSPQHWLPWEKIEMQIPVRIARIIHAFGRVFVFWLHKTEKEKQVESISINDSFLNIYYIFKKVDGSWSAQQKLPYDVKIDEKFESYIMKLCYERDYYQNLKSIYENWKAQTKTGVQWAWDGLIASCKKNIDRLNSDIKEKAQESKNVNKKFNGKLAVTLSTPKDVKCSGQLEVTLSTPEILKDIKCNGKLEVTLSIGCNECNGKLELTLSTPKEILIKDIKCSGQLEVTLSTPEEISKDIECKGKLEVTLSTLKEMLQDIKYNGKLEVTPKEILIKDIKYNGKLEAIPKEILIKDIKCNEVTPKEISKDIKCNGKLEVTLSMPQEILIVSLEDGFNNSKFIVKADLESCATDIVYLGDGKESTEQATQKIEDYYKEQVNNAQLEVNKLQNEIDEKQKRASELGSSASIKEKEKDDEEKSKNKLQGQIESIKESIRKRENLLEDVKKLDGELANLSSRDKKSIEESNLQTAITSLKDELSKLEQKAKSEGNTELQKKVESLVKELDSLEKIEALKIEALKTEKSELEKKIPDDKNIEKLKDEIEKYKEEKKELEGQKKGLEKEKGEKEKAGKAEEKNQKIKGANEIKLVKELITQRDKDEKMKGYEDEKVLKLITELYKEAYIGGTKIILLPKQQEGLDFKGFYGVYLWEIFFHIPTLIAYLFNQEQEFAKARKWYQYILNPTKKGCDSWQFIPFQTKCGTQDDEKCDSGKPIDSLDPYEEADRKKTSFEKYVIMSYVDNLIDWGDMLFSQASWEGINQATMIYIRAWDLLGEKPKKKGKFNIKPRNVCEVLTANKEMLCKAETRAPRDTNQKSTSTSSSTTLGAIKYCDYFCTPENKDFIGLWDRVEDRLYKIRHCLDIKGKHLELPLFQPPIDPRQLIGAAAGGSAVRVPQSQVPHYRFRYMINYAKSIADTVTQIGSELLSVLEKKDAEALTILYNKQEGIMASLITVIKEKAVEALKEEAKALDMSLSSAKDRESHYEKLINDGLSSLEKEAMKLSNDAFIMKAAASGVKGAAIAAHLIPTVFGLACGSFQPGSAVEAGASVTELAANILDGKANIINTNASYERRDQDWNLQKIMATYDVEQVGYQISANKINQANAEQDLKAHKESIKQIKEKEEFFKSKFTSQELYSWMKGELARLYFQVYKLALEIAKQAEGAYRYEIDNDKAFIQPGHWNSLKQGLLAGQKLKFDLEQMDKEYHDANERRLEITKVISLKQLDPIALYKLKAKGSCKFSFIEKLFDLDFPGHYARKVKDIKITIPAVVGPYENVHASLQQTSNKVVLKSEGAIKAIKYLLNPGEEEQPENDLLRVNWKPNQEIAISKADQDSGLFELSFGDERYLPFEGTGAVSTWELSLPQATNRFDISTISDVIIHLDYTALNGGEALSSQVTSLNQLKYYHGTLVANLSAIYPAEWEKFKQAKGQSPELKFKLSTEIFPTYINNPAIDLDNSNSICIIPITPDASKMSIKINSYNWERNTNKIVNPSLTIGGDWNIKINNADISKIEEIMIMVPYKATISW